MVQGMGIILGIAVIYIIVTTLVGVRSLKYTKSTSSMMSAKAMMGPAVIGILLMSEFIGTGSTLGTAQSGFEKGIWAAWNLVSLGIGFLLYAFLMAPKIQASGEYTISGVLSKTYGDGIRIFASIVMILALTLVNVSMYTGGGATVAKLLGVSIPTAVILLAVITILIVSLGGIRGVGYTNLIHASFKYIGLIVVAFVAYGLLKGNPNVSLAQLPAKYWTAKNIGYSTLLAWTVANIGAVFSTQYVLQSISSLTSEAEAKKASLIAAVTIVPIGFLAAYAGMSAKVLFPTIKSVNAIPEFLGHMSPWLAGVVVAGILAATFVTVLACTLGSTALVMKDFVIPFVKPSEKASLNWSRTLAVILGLAAVPFALFVPALLKVVFFARALRTILAVVAIFAFYAPRFSSKKGAMWSLILSTLATIFWFAFINSGPLGNAVVAGIQLKTIDNIFIAAIVPALIMVIDHFVVKRKPE